MGLISGHPPAGAAAGP